MKKKMAISFSGGRTSGFMTWWLINHLAHEYDFVVTFANTGQEHEKTLEFVNNCDKYFGFNTVWIEAAVHHGVRASPSAKIVTFDTASRLGEPFEESIKKHGIPNMSFPHCTDRLKVQPMTNYLRSIGWNRGDHVVSIGIRCDEARRVRRDAVKEKIIYPLVDIIPTTKQQVLDWWSKQPFDLNIAEHHGNCKWCWKKSLKKHIMLVKEMPEIYDFPKRMEHDYPYTGPHTLLTGYTGDLVGDVLHRDGNVTQPRHFFRKNMSAHDLFLLIQDDEEVIMDDATSECGESCEMYPMEILRG